MQPVTSMRRLGIIQPGRIGDIIICLPIAKWYADRGYVVIWPVAEYIANQMQGYIDYVHFIPLPDLDCNNARKIAYKNCNTVLDLAFCFPNSIPFNEKIYATYRKIQSFDQIKYEIAAVPFAEKWRLSFTRNLEAENKLFDELSPLTPYTLVHLEGSNQSCALNVPLRNKSVFVTPRSTSIFDWCTMIERAEEIVAIDSCFANLVEQSGLNRKAKKLIKRIPDVRPIYKDNWDFIDQTG